MKRTLLTLASIALLVVSCGKESSEVADAPSAPKFITVEAQIGALTRATTTGNKTVFDEGDQLSLYIWTDNQNDVPQDLVVNGVANTLKADGKWEPEQEMLWKDMTTLHYFLGIYPKRTVADFTADPFTLDDADYEKSDLLYALVLTGKQATDNPVNLTFDHAMAKLYVNMNFRNQWDGTPDITAVTATATNSCTINYLSRTITPTMTADAATAATVRLTAQPVSTNDNYAAKYSALMIPQDGFRTVSITIDGKEYTYTHTEDIPLVSGKFTTLNLIVGREKIEIGTVDINVWVEGTTLSGGQAL